MPLSLTFIHNEESSRPFPELLLNLGPLSETCPLHTHPTRTDISVIRNAFNGDGLAVVDGKSGKCFGASLIVLSMKVSHVVMGGNFP